MTEIVGANVAEMHLGLWIGFAVVAFALMIAEVFLGEKMYRAQEHAVDSVRAFGESTFQDQSTSQTMQSTHTALATKHLP
ncbi:hypothetical protein NU688_32710 [Variovorax sp. ZS18.2.2]|uniref:hypothetical protein n=1 Tax=Variovorax sp. ZS18.2.2 TaxID=2971255 RepID=UPI002151F0EA|nr:hypothetical protein [Variovorax sp. ZS18.2.2]MCR6480958.1 hypothetical protein [Variovorax sp. ZS18.2.2]